MIENMISHVEYSSGSEFFTLKEFYCTIFTFDSGCVLCDQSLLIGFFSL